MGAFEDGAFHSALSFAAGSPDIVLAVAAKEIDVAALNPSAYLTMAYRGTGLFSEPQPVAALAVMPSWDRMAFAVAERTGLAALGDIREQRYPLRLSIREAPTHATRFLVDEVLAAEGCSLRDIESWGGKIEPVDTPSHSSRLDAIEQGTIDAVFDEGIKGWGPTALKHGMPFLPLGASAEARLRAIGWPLGAIPRSRFPGLADEVLAPSFSGWPIITHTSLAEADAYRICRALEGAFGGIRWDSEEPVTLADVCRNTEATALEVPLHPGAERFYRERGCLP